MIRYGRHGFVAPSRQALRKDDVPVRAIARNPTRRALRTWC
jgi:hypothetical protein